MLVSGHHDRVVVETTDSLCWGTEAQLPIELILDTRKRILLNDKELLCGDLLGKRMVKEQSEKLKGVV